MTSDITESVIEAEKDLQIHWPVRRYVFYFYFLTSPPPSPALRILIGLC